MDPEQGKVLGGVLIVIGAVVAFVGIRLIGSNIVLGAVIGLAGAGILGLGALVRDVSREVSYERDVLD